MLEHFQNALMRLLLDRAFRQQFTLAPTAALASFALSPEERATLCALTPPALEACAQALLHKRWSQVQPVMPMTCRVCPSLRERYWHWLATHPAPVTETRLTPGAAEALRALPALHAVLVADQAEAVYAADLLAFEILQRCTRQDGQPRWLRSRFAVHLLVQEVTSGLLPFDPDPRSFHYRFNQRGTQWQPQTTTPQPGSARA